MYRVYKIVDAFKWFEFFIRNSDYALYRVKNKVRNYKTRVKKSLCIYYDVCKYFSGFKNKI